MPLALILPEDVMLPSTCSELEYVPLDGVEFTPISCEPSPKYNPKEAVDVVLELTLPEDVILPKNVIGLLLLPIRIGTSSWYPK